MPATGRAAQTHFRVHIVSEAFRGKSRIERHRMINQTLSGELAAACMRWRSTPARPDEGPSRRMGRIMKPVRPDLLATLVAIIGGLVSAQAQTFPAKPMRIIVPFAAGGGSDAVTRIVANVLAERLGQPIAVENRGGAGGNLGMEAGARAAPDGYTLTVVTQNMAVNPHLYKSLGFDPLKDFKPVALMNRFYQIVVVNPQVPAKTLAELIALAKAKPG